MSAAKKQKLVKFWNFTRGRPAYYRCPEKRFPHLSFRTGEHPLGYCLPCCKKTRPKIGSKSYAINRLCRKKHKVSPADLEGAVADDPLSLSRHILSYG